jgi:CRISPR/Cas system endoribonuclease Cas6 (RAMP superfamily)
MAFYQHGMGYSKLGFTDILDPEAFTSIMENASASFIANNISEDTLNNIYNKLLTDKSNFKNYLSNPNDYTEPVKTEQEIIDDIIGDNWDAFSDFLEKPDVVEEAGVEEITESLPEPTEAVTSISSGSISDFYNGLTEEEKNKLGNLEDLIDDYNAIPFDQPIEDYIETLKCKL